VSILIILPDASIHNSSKNDKFQLIVCCFLNHFTQFIVIDIPLFIQLKDMVSDNKPDNRLNKKMKMIPESDN